MQLNLSTDQQQIIDAVSDLLARYAGKDRALSLVQSGAYDHDLDSRLVESGFHEIALTDGYGPLDAALATHEVARAVGASAFGGMALVAPMVLGEASERPVVMATAAAAGQPVRLGGVAGVLVALDGQEAWAVETTGDDWVPVNHNRAGFPVARLKPAAWERRTRLGPGSGTRLRDWWRVEIAITIAGLMKGALDLTVDYLAQRKQFGRPIGSFQGVQHRLAQLAIVTEGARWLALEAAWGGARPDLAATAAAFATTHADQMVRECHQLHGAIGFTREYPLHLWTQRLLQVQQELGGAIRHRRDAAEMVFRDAEILKLSVGPAV
ncbi:MAG: acyl-CoA dehydrogenase [Phenylobacterium sp.]|nr:acyl-CoA dehydrogenase [Phenylobacterium sp.]